MHAEPRGELLAGASKSLLPANPSDFRTAAYWEAFFEARRAPFEWYCGLPELRGALAAACPLPRAPAPPPRLLVPGCGNSELSEELHAAGYTDTLSLDFDAGVVAAMRAKTAAACPGLQWAVASAGALLHEAPAFPSAAFAAVLDKGLLDAMLPCRDAAPDSGAEAAQYLAACARLLAPGSGVLLLVTLLQDHVLELLLQHLEKEEARRLWQGLDIAPIAPQQAPQQSAAAAAAAAAGLAPSPFLLTLRRSAQAFEPSGAAAAAAAAASAPVPMRLAGALHSAAGLPSAVRGLRWSQGLRAALHRVTGDTYLALDLWAAAEQWQGSASAASAAASGGIGAVTPAGTPPSELGFSPQALPLYTCTVVDGDAALPRCAVLLVPAGREHEWLFGSRAGQRALCRQAGVGRLILVTLGVGAAHARRFAAMTQAAVQQELSPAILTMLPAGSGGGGSGASGASAPACPYLAVAAELGQRAVVAEGTSALSGLYIVEDCVEEGEEEEEGEEGEGGGKAGGAAAPAAANRRRLVFASNRAALQSEVRLTRSGRVTHARAPCFAYHRAMAAAVASLAAAAAAASSQAGPGAQPALTVLVLGLGGGALPTYLATSLPCSPRLHVVAVELDPAIVQCAVAHFGLPLGGGAPTAVAYAEGGAAAASAEDANAGAARAVGEALTPPPPQQQQQQQQQQQPRAAPGGSVRVLVGDALHVLRLLSHPAFPASARPSVVLVDVNTGKEELAAGLSFPPPAFVEGGALAALAAGLGGREGAQLVAINLGAREEALAAAAVARVRAAFDGAAHLVRPSQVVGQEGEEEEEEEEEEDINRVLFAGRGAEHAQLKQLRACVPR